MRLVASWRSICSGRQLLEVAGIEAGGVVDQHVDAAEAVDGRLDRRLGVLRAGDVELDDEQVVGLAEGLGDGVGVAAGGDDVVAGGQRGLGEVDAHAAAGAGDEPCLLGGHASSKARIPRRWESLLIGVLAGSPRRCVPGLRWPVVDTRSEIREFLTSRRARITPDQAGLPVYGSRRVPGLRREEVAVLAGVSVPYYTRLERGDMSGVSESVLEALARALQLDEAERAHLLDLARAAQPTGARPRRRHAKQRVRPAVQRMLDAFTGAAALVGNERLDVLGANALGRAVFSELFVAPARPANFARFVFLEPRAEASTSTGTAPRARPSRSCAPPPAATLTTGISRTSSANCRCAARTSARAGPRTTCASTPPPSSRSIIPSSATSASTSSAWISPPTPA